MSHLVDAIIGCAAVSLLLAGQPCSCSSPGTPPGGGGSGGGSFCSEEICDGTDNDCDSVVDEECPCEPGQTQRCYTADPVTADVGVCNSGLQRCGAGVWGSPCDGEVGPSDEECDGFDNDCDGTIDEGCPCEAGTTQACYPAHPATMGIGRCQIGAQICEDGALGPCLGSVTPTAELCDGGDNDCDGVVDDGCLCPQGGGGPDLVALDTAAGTRICIDSTEVTRGHYLAWLDENPSLDDQPAQCSGNEDFTPNGPWPPAAAELDLPVTFVDWCDAYAFCTTRDKRLCGAIGGGSAPVDQFADPFVSEWFSACSDRGQVSFPYGNDYDPLACNGEDLGLFALVPVGSLPTCRGPTAVFDLSGNVWEWEGSCDGVTDWSDSCRIRGGGYNNAASDSHCAANATFSRGGSSIVIGFRCCADPLPPDPVR